jgi:fructose-specific phosphotransferase system IIC component
MDNKISFLAGYILTAATTISAAGFLNAIVLGLLGGFFGLLGKEAYYYFKREVRENAPKVKSWWAKVKAYVKSKG